MAEKKTAQLLPAYLIVGADELMRKRAVTRLKGYVDESLAAFNLDERTASADMDPTDLVASLNTMPMGSPVRLVIVSGADKLPKAVSEALVSYLGNPNPSCTLALVADALAKNTRLYKAVKKVGDKAVIECVPKKRYELPEHVQKMARPLGITIAHDAAAELVSRVGESTVMLETQLRTLAGICRDAGHITVEDVERHVARVAEVKPWDFLDALSERDLNRSLGFYRLLRSGSALGLLSLVTTRIRELTCARSLVARGDARGIASALGKQEWQVKNYARWVRRFGDGELEGLLSLCAECERGLKSGADQDAVMLKLVLAMCGRA